MSTGVDAARNLMRRSREQGFGSEQHIDLFGSTGKAQP